MFIYLSTQSNYAMSPFDAFQKSSICNHKVLLSRTTITPARCRAGVGHCHDPRATRHEYPQLI